MVNDVINRVFFVGSLLTIIVAVCWILKYSERPDCYNDISLLNIFVLFVYYLAIKYFATYGNRITKPIFYLIVCIYSIVFAIFYISIYFKYTGVYFDFQLADTVNYHESASYFSRVGIDKVVYRLFLDEKWDEIGAYVYATTLYSAIDSPLFVYFSNILLSLVSAIYLLKLSILYLPKKESILACSLFLLSSYYIYFHVSLFKETVFILFCIITVYNGQKFLRNSRFLNMIVFLIGLVVLSFFRIGTPVFILFSYGVYNSIKIVQLRTKNIIFVICVFPIIFYVVSPIFLYTYSRYTDPEFLAYYVDASSYGLSYFLHSSISIFCALFGPIPSIVALKEHEISSFYYSGYLVKYLFAPYFIISVYYILKNKIQEIYPLLIYYFLGSMAFGVALRGFDMRFLVTHSFFYYLICFVGLRNIQPQKSFHKKYFLCSFALLSIVLIIFNARL